MLKAIPNEDEQDDFKQLEKRETDEANVKDNILPSSVQEHADLAAGDNPRLDDINTTRSRPQKKQKRQKNDTGTVQKKWRLEVDLKALYTELRRTMTSSYPDEYRPEKVTEPRICANDMTSEGHFVFKESCEDEKAQIVFFVSHLVSCLLFTEFSMPSLFISR